jgi:PAS domain S-box-containing protein
VETPIDRKGITDLADEILESIEDCFYALDREGRFMYVNRKAETFWGISRADLLGKVIWELRPEIADLALGRALRQAAREDRPVYFETCSVVNGCYGEGSVYPNEVGVTVYWRDVTARKLADEERIALLNQVREAEARYHGLFEQVGDAILVADARARYIDVNDAASALLGYRREELLGMGVSDVVAAGPTWAGAEYTRFTREGRWRGELEVRRKDGALVPVEAHASEVVLPSGRIFVSILRDVSARKQAEREREELHPREREARAQAELATRLRDKVLATVSHDLKNPLAALRGYLQVTKRRLSRPNHPTIEQLQGTIEQLERLTNQMGQIIADLVNQDPDLVGQEARLALESIDLITLVRQLADLYQQTTSRHTIEVHTAREHLIGTWDVAHLRRIVANLLMNAIKYAPDGGTITISVGEEEVEGRPWAVLTVRDRGLGIPPEDIPHIFDWGSRATNVPRGTEGQGIGLSSARKSAELHGGTITVESEIGTGSTFTIRLPQQQPR